ncbi:hypothetical protein Pmani_038023 [Petrolisthes manimaculis]|uniref:Secreted protein n=1 Tax=Petrolisthes manimaculis TaxID=1843537 RepID=A0AAE1NH12_9EUCA|nr:hypothetical protein Pmani_038023 [Petrolisthes manimaculis]
MMTALTAALRHMLASSSMLALVIIEDRQTLMALDHLFLSVFYWHSHSCKALSLARIPALKLIHETQPGDLEGGT